MATRFRWLWSRPKTYGAVLLDAVAVLLAVLLTASVVDDDGWRGGLLPGGVLAGARLLLNSFLVWNSDEPRTPERPFSHHGTR